MGRLCADLTADFAQNALTLSDPADRFRVYLHGVRRMYDDQVATRAYLEIATLTLRDPALRDRLACLHDWTVNTFSDAIVMEATALSRTASVPHRCRTDLRGG
ncbi:hypothetical protein [Streptomyces sp. NPDC057580]|uniref:hypothetical protein n=1 Tax=Streptomyces sp. NPDC057580 TaxID=3346173 RepID=UPI003689CB7C